jgi:integrase
MAHYKQNGDKWVAEVRRKDFYKSKSWPTKKLAKQWATKLEAELDLEHQGRINTVKTFGDAVERYVKEVSISKPGERWERIKAKHLKKYALYSVYFDKLQPKHLADYRDTRQKQVQDATVLRELGFISAILTCAEKEWKWISYNPVSKIRKPKSPKPRERRISEEEITKVLKHLYFVEGQPITLKMHQVAALFLLAIETAMRTTEMTTLEWSQVKIDKRYVKLSKTKNGDSREVPLSKRAIEILSWLKGLHKQRVFTIESGSMDSMFRKAKKKAQIENLHFHDTRREATSRLAKKLDVMDLAKMTGHRDLKMLLNVYYKPDTTNIAKLLD